MISFSDVARAQDEWLDRVRSIQSWDSGGRRAPHKPLLLLYALGRFQRTGQAAVSFAEAQKPLRELLREYSPTGKVLHPEYPFFYLQNDGLWEIDRPVATEPGRSPTASDLGAAGVVGSLPPSMVTALQKAPLLFGAIVRHLLDFNFEPSLHDDICAMVGLNLEALDAGATVSRTRDPLSATLSLPPMSTVALSAATRDGSRTRPSGWRRLTCAGSLAAGRMSSKTRYVCAACTTSCSTRACWV